MIIKTMVCVMLMYATFYGRDHAGGNDKMKQLVPEIKVYGGSVDNVQGCTNKVENGDKLSLGADISILSLHTPWSVLQGHPLFLLFYGAYLWHLAVACSYLCRRYFIYLSTCAGSSDFQTSASVRLCQLRMRKIIFHLSMVTQLLLDHMFET